MKFIIICLLLLFVAFNYCISQSSKSKNSPTREEFLKKSKNQRTAAWILLGAGVASIAAVAPGNSDFGTTGTVAVLGGAAIVGSIPLFIAARKNKKRGLAKPVSLNFGWKPANAPNLKQYYLPALSLKIPLTN